MIKAKELGYRHQRAYTKRNQLVALPFISKPLKERFLAIARTYGMTGAQLTRHVVEEFCKQHEPAVGEDS